MQPCPHPSDASIKFDQVASEIFKFESEDDGWTDDRQLVYYKLTL